MSKVCRFLVRVSPLWSIHRYFFFFLLLFILLLFFFLLFIFDFELSLFFSLSVIILSKFKVESIIPRNVSTCLIVSIQRTHSYVLPIIKFSPFTEAMTTFLNINDISEQLTLEFLKKGMGKNKYERGNQSL